MFPAFPTVIFSGTAYRPEDRPSINRVKRCLFAGSLQSRAHSAIKDSSRSDKPLELLEIKDRMATPASLKRSPSGVRSLTLFSSPKLKTLNRYLTISTKSQYKGSTIPDLGLLMPDFHDRLKDEIHKSDYDFKSLSLQIGQGERYISNLLSTKSDPGFSNVVKICAALGLSPNQIAGLTDEVTLFSEDLDQHVVSAQAEKILTAVTRETYRKLSRRGVKPLLDDVLTWWHQQNGLLNNFDKLSEHVDLYVTPDVHSKLPEPYRVGYNSLAAQSFGVQSADHLRSLLTTFDGELVERVRLSHVETSKGEPRLSIEEIDVELPGHTFPLRFSYKRLLLPVRDSDGHAYVLNYSQALE
ncbi:MAG: helix-turn-helix transcriptional regulator [Pseudomonadota bacterium]